MDGKQYAISYGHLPGRAIARAKRLIDAELDKNFGRKTAGLKGSERIFGVAPKRVPAALIVEEGSEDETKIIRAEARHRFLNKDGIRVFSRPEAP